MNSSELGDLKSLTLSSNGKVEFYKEHRNNFSLMPGLPADGGTCPGATKGEGGCLWAKTASGAPTCYAIKLKRIYKGVSKIWQENTDSVVGKSYDEMVITLRNTVIKFLLNNKGGKQVFRIHVAGDFFSLDYAKAWAHIIREWPLVTYWCYTRSYTEELNVVPIFAGIKNISLLLSIDPQNRDRCLEVYNQYKCFNNISMAALGDTAVEENKFIPCPELTGKLKLEKGEGACGKCKLCFTHTDNIKLRNIRFKIH